MRRTYALCQASEPFSPYGKVKKISKQNILSLFCRQPSAAIVVSPPRHTNKMEAYDQDSKETSLVEIIDSAQRKLLKLQCKYNTKKIYAYIHSFQQLRFTCARVFDYAVRIYLNDMLTTKMNLSL